MNERWASYMKIGDKWLSLNALRAFEATGRLLHMSRAADELGLTQSAVSHQVRQLERALDIELFTRKNRTLRLTSAGLKLLVTVQQSFDVIASTILSINDDPVYGELVLATSPGFTYLWLAERLPDFLRRFPNLTLRRMVLTRDTTDLSVDTDVAISYGGNQFPGKRVQTLIELDYFPVCSASFVTDRKSLELADLSKYALIHEDNGEGWSNWFAACGLEQVRPVRNIYAGSEPVAMSLAKDGLGFALNVGFYGEKMMARNGLIRPFGQSIENYERYYLVTNPEDKMSVAAKEFESWLMTEVKKSKLVETREAIAV